MALRIDTKRGRAELEPRREPYWHKLIQDRHLGFRKLEDGTGTWIARYREDGDRRYQALGDVTDAFGFDEAVTAAQAWFRECDRGVKHTTETVADACKAYVKDRRAQKGEAAANDAHRRFERTVYGGGGKKGDRYDAHEIADVRLAKVRRRMLAQWRDGLRTTGLSKASANRTLTALRAALNLAVRDRHVSADIALEWRGVKPFADAHKRRELYLDINQRRALLEASSGSLRKLVEAAALTGARAGELINTRRSAFDARTRSITLSGKTGSRMVPLSQAAVDLFTRLAKDKLPGAFLLTRDDGEQWKHSDWDEHVRAAATKAELPAGTCLYTLRHSWITAALLGGMSPLEVAKLVGTSLIMIDKNYGHLASESARERLAKVPML